MKKYISHRSINLFIVFLGILTTGGFTSCNFLRVDDYFDDTMKFDSIFTKYEYLVQYMWGTSDQFPDESRILSDPVTPGPMARMKLSQVRIRSMAFADSPTFWELLMPITSVTIA